MKIAIATDKDYVSQHFGRCERYTIAEIKDGEVISREEVDAPAHEKGVLPDFISQFGVDTVIVGGMGRRAQDIFRNKGVEIIIGVSGSIDEVIENLISGELVIGDNTCTPGSGKGNHHPDHNCNH
jgi:predicted Fe-Mo cluster-binding NifX family protein